MKFSVSKEKLIAGLQTVQNVVSTRTTLPILSNVLLHAADGQLRLTTTDLDVGVSGVIDAQIDKPGSTTLPARRLANIVRELPAAEVQIEIDAKNVASIRCGQSFFKILGLPEEEFPRSRNLKAPRPSPSTSRLSATRSRKPATPSPPTRLATS